MELDYNCGVLGKSKNKIPDGKLWYDVELQQG